MELTRFLGNLKVIPANLNTFFMSPLLSFRPVHVDVQHSWIWEEEYKEG